VPELPEVETVRRDLEVGVKGRTVRCASVSHPRAVRRHDAALLVAGMTGRLLGSVDRIGKYLVVSLGDAGSLVVHLRMSGRLLVCSARAPRVAHTHVVLDLDDGRQLRFVDPRTFGELFISPRRHPGSRPPELAVLGPDVLDELRHPADLAVLLAGRGRRLKDLLVDQRVMTGLGNIYADEILFAAGLCPLRPGGTLTATEVTALHRALRRTLKAAIRARGSTLGDGGYVDVAGRAGTYQRHHAVYARAGQPCRRCRTPLCSMRVGGRSTVWCLRCQR
jgi:formamidopyrimidine-DNA glycosylase